MSQTKTSIRILPTQYLFPHFENLLIYLNVSGTGKMRLLEEKSHFQILTYLHRTFYSEHYGENLV